MNFDEIADRAYRRLGPDKFYNLPQNFAYYQLQELYYKYKLGNISKENSIIEKKKIEKEYEENIIEYNRSLECYKEYNKNRIENTLLLAEIEKARSKEKIIEPALKIIANCTSDDSFVERVIKKITQDEQN